MKLNLPLQHASAGGGDLGFRHMTGVLQGDGERGVGERVGGGEGDQRESRSNGSFKAAGVAQGADQAMVGFNMSGIDGEDGAEGACGRSGIAGGKQVESALGEQVGSGVVDCGHGCIEDIGWLRSQACRVV